MSIALVTPFSSLLHCLKILKDVEPTFYSKTKVISTFKIQQGLFSLVIIEADLVVVWTSGAELS